jgi:hypothetical protein
LRRRFRREYDFEYKEEDFGDKYFFPIIDGLPELVLPLVLVAPEPELVPTERAAEDVGLEGP